MSEDGFLEPHHYSLITMANELEADPALVVFLTMVCAELARHQRELEELQGRFDETQKAGIIPSP